MRKSYLPFFDRFARRGAEAVVAIGAVALIGWLLDIPLLKSLLPGLATMKINSACTFIAAGTALWLLHTGRTGSNNFRAARMLAVLVIATGSATLAQDFFALELGIDQFLIRDYSLVASNRHPGRMSPVTALAFVFVGFALLMLKSRDPRIGAAVNWTVWPPIFISALALAGYAYGVHSLYQVKPFVSIALSTALAFLILSLSVVAANSQRGMISIAGSDTAGGFVCRVLAPIILLSLFVLGWACLLGQKMGLYGTEFGFALMVLISMTVCMVAIGWSAIRLHKIDGARARGDATISTLTEGIEGMAQERTARLAQLSKALNENRSLELLSHEDGLTKLANRRRFDSHLASQVALARRKRQTLSLILFDVDAFKAFNDQYGHPAGDECLRQVAAVLKSSCRRPSDLAARYGGEEFALILPDTEAIGAIRIAEDVRRAVAQLKIPHAHSPAGPFVSICGGVSVFMAQLNISEEQLIHRADEALFEAKRTGRNRIVSLRDQAA